MITPDNDAMARSSVLGPSVILVISLVFMVVVAALGVVGWRLAERHRSLHFTIIFHDAKGLRTGQDVVYGRRRIGEIRDVQLLSDGRVAVSAAIEPEYKAYVYQEAVFIIERMSLLDMSGESKLEMKDALGPRTPIQQGAVIRGTDSIFDELLKGVVDILRQVAEAPAK